MESESAFINNRKGNISIIVDKNKFKDEPKYDLSLWKDNKYFKIFGRKLNKTFIKGILKNNKGILKGLKFRKRNIFDAEFSIISYDLYIMGNEVY